MKENILKPLRTFGRSKGKPLSTNQELLMQKEYPKIDISKSVEFAKNPLSNIEGEVWLEIGFGGAEHLLWQAKNNPDITIIGVEPFLNGIVKAVKGVVDQGLKNILLYRGDARQIINLLPDSSINRVFILFPDPWQKKRHNKRRLINEKLLSDLYRVIQKGGALRFGSDITDYVDWVLTKIKRHNGYEWHASERKDWMERPENWPKTRYLEKALREGRQGYFFDFIKF